MKWIFCFNELSISTIFPLCCSCFFCKISTESSWTTRRKWNRLGSLAVTIELCGWLICTSLSSSFQIFGFWLWRKQRNNFSIPESFTIQDSHFIYIYTSIHTKCVNYYYFFNWRREENERTWEWEKGRDVYFLFYFYFLQLEMLKSFVGKP